jgi:hypothetical protein
MLAGLCIKWERWFGLQIMLATTSEKHLITGLKQTNKWLGPPDNGYFYKEISWAFLKFGIFPRII